MNGKLKTILLVVLLIVVAAIGFYKVEKTHEAKQKQLAIQQQKEQEAKQEQANKIAAEKAAYEAQQQSQQSNQVVGATTYPDAELINIANENYAAFMHNNNTYKFENVISKQTNGDVLTATFSATCNGQPQTITMSFQQVNNVVTIVKSN
ncbi:MAG: hypothetical protein ACRDCW_15195 [Sarcina sp.]